MKKLFLFLFVASVVLGGCSVGNKVNNTGVVMEENKVTMTGKLSTKSGEEWVFIKDDGEVVNVTSQKVNLESYTGKKITIEGMFSGSTLYVDIVK